METMKMQRGLIPTLAVLVACLFTSAICAQEPDSMATLRKGIDFHNQGNYKRAIDVYQSLLADNPKDELALYESAVTYMAMKNYAACIEQAQRSAAIKSRAQAMAIAMVASCQDDDGQLNAALKTFAKGVHLYPQDVQLNFNYGVSLHRSGNDKRAVKHLQIAIEQAPAYASPYLLYADIRKHQGYPSIATLLYFRFLMNEPFSDRSADVAKTAVEPFIPREDNKNIELNIGFGRAGETYASLDLMLAMARTVANELADPTKADPTKPESIAADKSVDDVKTAADRAVTAMETFFALAQELDRKEAKMLAKDFGWKVTQPLWTVLAEKELLKIFFYHVASLAGVEGARQRLASNREETSKLNEVLTSWRNDLRK